MDKETATTLVTIAIPISIVLAVLLHGCWKLLMRHLNIRAHGWPPAHCDADGEPVYTDEDGY